MKYFSTLPFVAITKNGHTTLYRNLMSRVSMIPSLSNNPLIYYSYDIQEGDTPEIVAEKYYGTPYRYWIIMFANQMFDAQWDWPLNNIQFQNYIADKYDTLGIDPYTETKSYRKIITVTNQVTGVSSTDKVEITASEYNSMQNSSKTVTINGENVLVATTKEVLSYYNYEVEVNESKRNIKLLNKDYVQQIENEFEGLMNGAF